LSVVDFRDAFWTRQSYSGAGNMKHVNDSTCLGKLLGVDMQSLLDKTAGTRKMELRVWQIIVDERKLDGAAVWQVAAGTSYR
jgi:hypothetical protein